MRLPVTLVLPDGVRVRLPAGASAAHVAAALGHAGDSDSSARESDSLGRTPGHYLCLFGLRSTRFWLAAVDCLTAWLCTAPASDVSVVACVADSEGHTPAACLATSLLLAAVRTDVVCTCEHAKEQASVVNSLSAEPGASHCTACTALRAGRAALPALATAGGEASLPPSSRTALAALLDAAGAVLAELHDSAPWRLALYELVRAQIGLSYSPAAPSPPRQQQPQATRRPPAGEPAVPLVSQSYNQFLTADADAAPPACSPAAFAALVGPPLWRRQGYAARPPRAIVYPSDSDDDGSTSSSSSSSSSCNCASRASPPGSSSSSSRRRQRHALEGKPAAAPGEESSQEVSDGASSASEDDDASDVDEAGLSLTTRRRPAWWWPPHSASPTNELWRACAAGNVTAVARLLADPCYTTDAVINAAGPDAWTPLAVACLRAQDAALVAALLHAGADASRTPSLLFAVLRACDLRLLRLFCDMQPAAVVSVRDRFGASLLHAALAEDCVPAVQLLARAAGGALVNAPIVDLEELDEPRAKIRPAGAASIPALAYLDRSAFTSPRLPSAAALASCAAPPTAAAPPLAWSPRMRAFPVSAAAEAMYYDDGFLGCHRIRAAETPGMTPLGLALAMGNLDAVAAVLEAGGDPNAPASRSRGSAPSVFESLSKLRPQGGGRQGQGARDAVALLVEAGADLNVAVGGGAGSGAGGQSAPTDTAVLHCPALHAACAAADYRSVVLLLRAGACSAAVVPPGSPRGGGLVPGNSPLHTAAAAATVGNCRSIKLQRLAKCATTLLAAGAPAAAPNGAGKAAWEVVAGVKAADLAAAFGGPAAPLSSAAEVKK